MVDDDRPNTGQQPAADEPQGLVPPYDDLRGDDTGEGAEASRKAFDASNAGAAGPPPPVSEQERTGMSSTEMNPEPPLGVGESRGGRAEDLASDRDDVGTKGESGRPVGRAVEDDHDDRDRPRDPASPDLQTG